ncbi:MAG: N-acetylmuramoyl-L-alanine amidase [Candidatus Eremiobacteraeota bacterium]|nr:N-acetylmuramoyl-L-alanine amidase [Candidatus Eremiobacteraeota bacterium]MBV8671216.1 N-acetylmuramoyl-L-alanine amidase [Candidatus Eremiobacteraeota bacterium]
MKLLRVTACICALLASVSRMAAAQPVAVPVTALADQVFVSGREVRFEHLGSFRGAPVVRVDDPGLGSMLEILGAKMQFQPGTRFVVFTRADGTLITFTVGSNALSVDDSSRAMPFGPFYQGTQLYIPLQPLTTGLGLYERHFHQAFAFSPQIVSVQRRVGQQRTIVEIIASAPLTWRSSLGGPPKHPALVLTFPGFANAAGSHVTLGGREAKAASLTQQGPPGFPITTLTIEVMHGVKYAAHRVGGSSQMALVLAHNEKDLALSTVAIAPAVHISAMPTAPPTQAPTPVPTPAPTVVPSPAARGAVATAAPVPTAVPAPQISGSPSAVPSGAEEPGAQVSPGPSPSPLQKITDIFVTDTTDASRITLAVTGPVSFEWHRLAAPDNRFWIDISAAALIGPARDIAVKLPQVRSVKISQHLITPDHVVRVIIDPSQPVDVVIGAIQGAPNQLGIEIHASPPPVDAPQSGIGMMQAPAQTAAPNVAVTPGPKHADLIVIDPGHGGNDPGAMNQQYGLVESHLTLAISQKLKADLQHAGWRVVLTRDGDYEVGDPNGDDHQELQARCDVANAAGARLFISVHINSSVSSAPSGLTTYYWRPADRSFAQTVQAAAVRATGAGDDGVMREAFYVTRHTVMPAVLIENTYLSNAHDASLLTQSWFIDRIAAGIAQGVKDYTGGPPSS